MRLISKTLALLLLVAVIVSPLAGRTSDPAKPVPGQAADCHADSQKAPAPVPASHNCCKTAHDPAILPQSLTWQPTLVHVSIAAEFDRPPITVSAFTRARSLLIQPGDPPVTRPLLI